MVKVELEKNTFAVLISGLYCTFNNINVMAIPESLWIEIAEKLEYFIDGELWDFSKISFEEWVRTGLFIYPKELLSEEDLEEMQNTTLCWDRLNGNAILVVSMDIKPINGDG